MTILLWAILISNIFIILYLIGIHSYDEEKYESLKRKLNRIEKRLIKNANKNR